MTVSDKQNVKIVSWNVNGIRAAAKGGFFKWLEGCDADFVLLQEVRAELSQFQTDWLEPFGYKGYWHPAQKKGYSGVGIYTRHNIAPSDIVMGMGCDEYDCEGRFLGLVYKDVLINSVYFPNSQRGGARVDFKVSFCEATLKRLQEFRKQGLKVVVGGDFNIAHTAIDLANPKQNEKNAGYLPEERQWMSHFLSEGFVDSFRMFETRGGFYTWWKNFPPDVRARNIGWRLDYLCPSDDLKPFVKRAQIHAEVLGSDHCPVSMEFSV